MVDLLLLTQILIIIALIAFSAFFSSSETALTAMSESVLQKRISEGHIGALKTKKLLLRKEMVLSAILLGNNLVNILSSALATHLFVKNFGSIGVLYATFTMTAAIFILAEVLPKTYAITRADTLALRISPFVTFLVWFLTPINKLVNLLINFIIKIKRKNSKKEDMDRLRGAILLADKDGGMMRDNRVMLESVLDLSDIEISEIMVHRKDISSININKSKKSIVKLVTDSPYSRLPVWENNSDNIIGILHVKDLFRSINSKKQFTISSLLQKPWFVPEKTSLSSQLQEFREENQQLALVVDEYGTFLGIVTLEDILEEIVGQIYDEHDRPSNGINYDQDNNVLVAGNKSLRDINRYLDWNIPDEEASTIGGLIINVAQRIPQEGESFVIGSFLVMVVTRSKTRITSVRISKINS